jgi:hypothetical protein
MTGRTAAAGRWQQLLLGGLGAILISLVAATSAGAAFGDGVAIHYFNAEPNTAQAGGHPDLTIEFNIDNRYDPQLKDENGEYVKCACNDAKDIVINFPAGFIGNPHATPQCDAAQFAFDECPIDSQVGITTPSGCLGSAICSANPEPVNNLVPPPGSAGLTGFKIVIFNAPVYEYLTARTGGDYGLRATVSGTERVFPIPHFLQILWGVPADPEHDEFRFKEPCTLLCLIGPGTTGYASNSPLTPYLSNPTTCGQALSSTIDITAYDNGHTHAEAPWPATTGCSQLAFNPSLSATPTTTDADTPSGLDIELTVPQTQSPTVPSPSQIKASEMTLPPGFTINPNAADGKTACLDVSAKFGTEDESQCPEFAKVGTVAVESAVLPGVLPGAVYLGEPQPGNRYRIFLVADGFGLHVKLAGSVIPDPDTGQLVVSFKNLPEAPFERFQLHLFGSERGSLATPTKCGTYPVSTTFTPWNSALAEQTSVQYFTINSGPNGTPCPGAQRPFAPRFAASSEGSTAGAHAPFTVKLSRDDGDQNLTGLSVTTPPGFSGILKGIPYCSEAAIGQLQNLAYLGMAELATSACPAASQIGTASAAAGAGSKPITTNGKVYLAGPYKGAPLSLVVVVPAVSGPYDVGNVAVRAAIQVDSTTARVTTVSDPFPRILGGIPLRVREITVRLDRPNFALNPTNCKPFTVDATINGDEGGSVARNPHYQVANCAKLPFGPKLSLKLSGGLRRRGHPAILAVLTKGPGEANLDMTSVTLPRGELLDNSHIGTVCTRVQFAADTCPESSKIGTAEAITPLLDEPLRGPVVLRSSSNQLPDMVLDLEGQVDFTASARIDSVKGRLRTTFEGIPDVPVSKVTVDLLGGNKGLLQNSESLCGTRKKAVVRQGGQNGRRLDTQVTLQATCGAKPRHKRRNSRHGRTGG